jgi:hypothetical protein
MPRRNTSDQQQPSDEQTVADALHLLSRFPDFPEIEAAEAHEAWLNGSAALSRLVAARDAARVTCLACSEARERMHHAEDERDAAIAALETLRAVRG